MARLTSYFEYYGSVFAANLDPGDVRAGVSWEDSEGDFHVGALTLPEESQVLLDIGYGDAGTEFIGTLESYAIDRDSNVDANGQIRSPLWIGTDYLAANGNGFRWRVKAPAGLVPADVSVYFRARRACSKSTAYAWDVLAASVTAVTVDSVTYWDIEVSLLATHTAALSEGIYRWWLVAETLTADLVLKEYNSYPPLRLARA